MHACQNADEATLGECSQYTWGQGHHSKDLDKLGEWDNSNLIKFYKDRWSPLSKKDNFSPSQVWNPVLASAIYKKDVDQLNLQLMETFFSGSSMYG